MKENKAREKRYQEFVESNRAEIKSIRGPYLLDKLSQEELGEMKRKLNNFIVLVKRTNLLRKNDRDGIAADAQKVLDQVEEYIKEE